MFIWTFMAGVVETIAGEEEDYDPHKHRKVEHPTSYLDTMIHLLKGSIGAGILAMPEAVNRMGIVFGVVGIAVIGFFATYCIQLLIEAQYILCIRHKRGYMAYPRSIHYAIEEGPPCLRWSAAAFYYFVDVVLVAWQLGICTIYFVFVASNIKQVCDFYGTVMSIRLHLCFVLVPCIIVNLVKNLKLMTPLSTLSNFVTILGLLLVFFYLIEDDIVPTKSIFAIEYKQIPLFVGTTLFALEAVGVVLALEYNMEHPKLFVGLFGLFNIGMVIIMALYGIVGVFGALKYGNEIKASITLNLPQNQKKAQAAKIIFALAIFLTFPLQNFVAYNIIWRKLQKKFEEGKQFAPDYCLRIILVLIPFALAVAVPHLGPFIALFGALCLSMLAMVFPGVMDMCIWYRDGYGVLKYKLIRAIVIIIIGTIAMVAGVYSSIIEILES